MNVSVDHFQYRKGSVTVQIFCVDMKYSKEKLYCQTVSDGRYVPNIHVLINYLHSRNQSTVV